jgi:hypothetical protein
VNLSNEDSATAESIVLGARNLARQRRKADGFARRVCPSRSWRAVAGAGALMMPNDLDLGDAALREPGEPTADVAFLPSRTRAVPDGDGSGARD